VASLTKRPRNKNKPWTVQWYDGAGKRREAAFRTNREAKDFKIKLEHDEREGTFVDPRLGREPFSDAAKRWLAGLAVAPETRRAYRSVLDNHSGRLHRTGKVPRSCSTSRWWNCPASGAR
jgi:hypothetical protein